MMKKLALVVPLAFALFVVLPVAAAEDFTGKWSGSFTGTMDGQQHTEPFILNMVHKGAALTGTIGPSDGQQWKLENAKVDGNNVAFEVQAGGDSQGPRMKFTLAFADGHLKGDLTAEKEGQKLTAKVDVTRVK